MSYALSESYARENKLAREETKGEIDIDKERRMSINH
jgi:hypothetical protein